MMGKLNLNQTHICVAVDIVTTKETTTVILTFLITLPLEVVVPLVKPPPWVEIISTC